ncbi:uncharacterized protein LOC107784781 [Nicotiana tabacum]|uniref:Uncharacterized protein LOC107784781 n=1 Tax=Nicotiana tabacum TaxID=4097 RepID=A0A1S3ZAH3_TOBAC|nr:PREDICTED: uncharacterized protein LOC107784781 isoform X2 [Nicotiana tabacum]
MIGKNSDSELPPGFATPRSINPPCFKSTAIAITTAAATISIPISDQSEKCNMHDQCQGETTFSVNGGRGRPRKQTPVSAEAPSMATKETPAVSLLPVPPLGSSIDAPLLITDEEQRETKINLNPLLMLNPPPNPCLWNEYSSNIHEEVKTT